MDEWFKGSICVVLGIVMLTDAWLVFDLNHLQIPVPCTANVCARYYVPNLVTQLPIFLFGGIGMMIAGAIYYALGIQRRLKTTSQPS